MSNNKPAIRWKPGQSGNPNGRPKKDQTLMNYIRAKLKEQVSETDKRMWLVALADAELKDALTDTTARKNLFDRLLGKASEAITLTGANGGPVVTRVTIDAVSRDCEQGTETAPAPRAT